MLYGEIMRKVLIIDDEPIISEAIQAYLTAHKYEIFLANDGETGYAFADHYRPDLILLDINMPREDGFSVCNRLKQNRNLSSIPIIILSVRAEEVDKIIGLEIGADDYVTKPVGMRELLARIKAVLRRSSPYHSTALLTYGDVRIDFYRHCAYYKSTDIHLTVKELDLLHYLITRAERIVTRDEILDALWGPNYDGELRVVDNHVKNLRAKLRTTGCTSIGIINIHGRGYRWGLVAE